MTTNALDGFVALGPCDGLRGDDIELSFGADWLEKQIQKMADWVRNSATSSGTRSGTKRALNGLARGSFGVLAGPAETFAASFLDACLFADTDAGKYVDLQIPTTLSRTVSSGRFDHDEPCGIAVSETNLGPEWIRHFLGVFYDKDIFEKVTAQKFYPLENRDHFIHSLLVFALGELVMQLPINDIAVSALASELKIPKNQFSGAETVEQFIRVLYRIKYPHLFANLGTRWLNCIWPAVAFWHDAGYDAATWCLLTFREFGHSRALDPLAAANIPSRSLEILSTAIGDDLDDEPRNALMSIDWSRPYRALWEIEGCALQQKEKRPWGRLHAFFSAYEFLKCFEETVDPTKTGSMLKHLAVAIAEHHEPWGYKRDRLSEKTLYRRLASKFARNPIGEFLKFVDALAAFARVKVDAVEEPSMGASGRSGKFIFQFNYNADPLWIIRDESPPRFFQCRPYEPKQRWKYSLLGVIDQRKEEKRNPKNQAACGRICNQRLS